MLSNYGRFISYGRAYSPGDPSAEPYCDDCFTLHYGCDNLPYPIEADTNYIDGQLRQGEWLMGYWGHGAINRDFAHGIFAPLITFDSASAHVRNSDRLPFVIDMSCGNAEIDPVYSDRNIIYFDCCTDWDACAETALIKSPYGVIGFVGASRTIGFESSKMYDSISCKLLRYTTHEVGRAYLGWKASEPEWWEQVRKIHYMGDPALDLFSNPVSGDVTQDATWGGKVVLGQNTTVATGATLTVSYGTEIILLNGAELLVQGRLIAEGTTSHHIRIHGTIGQRTGRVRFSNSNGQAPWNQIKNCDLYALDEGIHNDNSTVNIENCMFSEVNTGLLSASGNLQISGYVNLEGGNAIMTADAHLNFEPSATLTLSASTGLHVYGAADHQVIFDCSDPNLQWSGLTIRSGGENYNVLQHVVIQHATVGVSIISDSTVGISDATISNCGTGVVLTTNAFASISNSDFHGNGCGIACLTHSRLNLSSSTLVSNANYGLNAASGGDLRLNNVVIQDNGGEHGFGCGMQLISSHVSLGCSSIDDNWGPGIFAGASTVMMSGSDGEMSCGGNRIAHNDRRGTASASEILAGGLNLIMDNGYNDIEGASGRRWISTKQMVCPLVWRHNYWGIVDTVAIKTHLSPTITVSPVMTSWSSCQGGETPYNVAEALYTTGHSKMSSGQYTAAREDFHSAVGDVICGDQAGPISAILATDLLAGDEDYSVEFFTEISDTAQEHSTVLQATYARAWELAYSGYRDSAQAIMQEAVGEAQDDMEIMRAHLELLSLEYFHQSLDTTDTLVAEKLQAMLDSMEYWYKWNSSHLQFDLQQGSAARYQRDSLQVGTAVYLFNDFMQAPSDTITEVGFRFKSLPDSTNWTAYQTNAASGDSIYNWQVPIGRMGGLINYIFWAKDAQGRFATSPMGADTANPDSGMTHFLSVEIGADTIRYPDSVVVWAPTELTHDIHIVDGGILVIKPWPGATDHTVRLGDSTWIDANVMTWDTISNWETALRQKIYLLGTEEEPILFAPAVNSSGDDSAGWGGVGAYSLTNLYAKHVVFRTSFFSLCVSTPSLIQVDSCQFDSVTSIAWINPNWDDTASYVRHTEFSRVGRLNYDYGGVMICDGHIEMSDCRIHDNAREGLILYCTSTLLERLKVDHNHGPGLVAIGENSEPNVRCCEFSFNGDTLPEVFIEAMSQQGFDNQAGCVFMDSVGPLFKLDWFSSGTNLQNGGNGFYLLGGTGKYIERVAAEDTLDITGNFWYPVTPDSSAFLSFLSPDSARFWNSATFADSFIACVGMEAGLPTAMVPHVGNGDYAAPTSSVNSGPTVATIGRQAIAQPQQGLAKTGDHLMTASPFRHPLSKFADAGVMSRAMTDYFNTARKTGAKAGLSAYYASMESQLPTVALRTQAHWLQLKSLELEGQQQQALHGYEEIIRQPEGKADSVAAILSAMRLHFAQAHMKKPELASMYPQYRVTNAPELARRSFKLVRSLYGNEKLAGVGPHTAPIPKAYKLYQNYPNPFNPVTEIRFDVPEKTRVELRIFNILGQQVTTLVDEVRTVGAYHILWDGKSAGGVPVSSGMYIYQLKCDKFVDAKKMILLR
jgi:hypothetical protein